MTAALDATAAISTFAQYGVRRTSMDDLARALMVSRQTVYNRFGNKEAVWSWALETFFTEMLDAAKAELAAPGPTTERLTAALMRWEGDHVDVLRASAHGAEILELAAVCLREGANDPTPLILEALSTFLVDATDLTAREADDRAFTLLSAAKGLLAASPTTAAFEQDIQRIVRTLIST